MKLLIPAIVAFAATGTLAQAPKRIYPSCDLAAQHAMKGEIGGKIKDAGLAHVSMRADILQADIGSARKARRLTQVQADRLWRRAETIRGQADGLAAQQGFLSAAERATYDRELDAISAPVCRR